MLLNELEEELYEMGWSGSDSDEEQHDDEDDSGNTDVETPAQKFRAHETGMTAVGERMTETTEAGLTVESHVESAVPAAFDWQTPFWSTQAWTEEGLEWMHE